MLCVSLFVGNISNGGRRDIVMCGVKFPGQDGSLVILFMMQSSLAGEVCGVYQIKDLLWWCCSPCFL